MEPDPLDFFKKYELISNSEDFIISKTKSSICRYCGRTDKDVSFREDTHLLPELLGKNSTKTFDECDSCNDIFSDYESNFSVFVRPYLTLLGIKGKKKIPTFMSRTIDRKEETRTSLKHAEGNQKELHIQNIDDYKINTNDKTFEITFRKQPYVPLKVYKALLKIGLSLLPRESDKQNAMAFEWLTSRSQDINLISDVFIITLKKRYFSKPSAYLYKSKELNNTDKILPEYILIVCFANQVIQSFLPFSNMLELKPNDKRNIDLIIFPSFVYDNITGVQQIDFKKYELHLNNTVSENLIISFSYDSIEFNLSRTVIMENNFLLMANLMKILCLASIILFVWTIWLIAIK